MWLNSLKSLNTFCLQTKVFRCSRRTVGFMHIQYVHLCICGFLSFCPPHFLSLKHTHKNTLSSASCQRLMKEADSKHTERLSDRRTDGGVYKWNKERRRNRRFLVGWGWGGVSCGQKIRAKNWDFKIWWKRFLCYHRWPLDNAEDQCKSCKCLFLSDHGCF